MKLISNKVSAVEKRACSLITESSFGGERQSYEPKPEATHAVLHKQYQLLQLELFPEIPEKFDEDEPFGASSLADDGPFELKWKCRWRTPWDVLSYTAQKEDVLDAALTDQHIEVTSLVTKDADGIDEASNIDNDSLNDSDNWTDAHFQLLAEEMIEWHLKCVKKGQILKLRREALRWIFRPEETLVYTTNAPPKRIPTLFIPFSFRHQCALCSLDADTLIDGLYQYLASAGHLDWLTEAGVNYGDRYVSTKL